MSNERKGGIGFFVRWFAVLLDLHLIYVPSALIGYFTGLSGSVVAICLMAIYFVCMHGRFGRTLGEMALDLEVVGVATGRRPTYHQAFARLVSHFAPVVILIALLNPVESPADVPIRLFEGLYFLWLLGHARGVDGDPRAGWDRRAGTLVRYRARAVA